MEFQELKDLIENLAQVSKISQSDIIRDLAEYGGQKYVDTVSANERKLIDLVKEKLIDGFFDMANHRYVTNRPNYAVKFGFDKLEMDVLPKAASELEKEELIEGNSNYIGLTDKGVLKAKQLRGEL